jgi:mono/diheme cytochrome c family protein
MIRAIAIIGMVLAVPAMAQQAPVPLKPGTGLDAVTVSCGVCHTLNYIRMNSPFLTPDGWKAEVTKMRQAFGAPIDEDTAPEIINYLNANYGPPKS